MTDDAFLWRVEAACRNAWPTPHESIRQGWLYRFAGGDSSRLNSVNPLYGPRESPEATLAAAETFYGRRRARPLFRVTDLAGDMEDVLVDRGYQAVARTTTLAASVEALAGALPDPEVTTAPCPDPVWLAARQQEARVRPDDIRAFAETAGMLAGSAAFGSLAVGDRIAAIALAVVSDRLLVFESVATLPEFRGRGLARRVVGTLMAWGRQQGAEAACLQVLCDNTSAIALYRRLGFDRELYRYHYRAPPGSCWCSPESGQTPQ
jgi:ribosomal protein S18 acetylase RimI-like enzyme